MPAIKQEETEAFVNPMNVFCSVPGWLITNKLNKLTLYLLL